VKKGFLLDRKDPGLYPDEGSSEGSGGSKGGSLARIMDKCKVVNMNADNTISEHPSMPPAPPSSAGAAAAASASGGTVTGTMKKKKPFANKELDELFAKLDEDLKPLCTDEVKKAHNDTVCDQHYDNCTLVVSGLLYIITL
jgi:hypothetical protein